MRIGNETISIQVKCYKGEYDTKLEIEQEISKLLFSLFHQGKLVDFRIIDKDYDGIDNVIVNEEGE